MFSVKWNPVVDVVAFVVWFFFFVVCFDTEIHLDGVRENTDIFTIREWSACSFLLFCEITVSNYSTYIIIFFFKMNSLQVLSDSR